MDYNRWSNSADKPSIIRLIMQNSTIWRNNKTNQIYRVWLVAHDLDNTEYVVYEKLEIQYPQGLIFSVKHSETEAIGICQKLNGKWLIKFNLKLDNTTTKYCPWARPAIMWHEKFTSLEKD